MGLRQRIGRALERLARVVKAEYANDLTDIGFTGGMSGGGLPTNASGWLRKFATHPRLRAAVARIGRDVARQPWHLHRLKLDPDGKLIEKSELLDHPLLNLWSRPHPKMPGTKWRYIVQCHLDLAGEAFLLARYSGGKTPTELWPVPPHWVSRTPGDGRGWFELSLPGNEIPDRVPAGQMLWLSDPDPYNPYGRGLGVARALDDEVAQDEWAAKWNNQFFRRGARPDLLVTIPGLEPKDYEKVRQQWEARHEGFWNSFRAAFLNQDCNVKLLSQSHRDLEFNEGRRQLRDIIFQTFGLSPEVMGVVENSNRATADAALYLHALNIVDPRLSYLEEEFNQWLVPMYGDDNLRLCYESPVKETEQFRINKSLEAFRSGVIQRNECRRELGWDPISGPVGDEILAPSNMNIVLPGASKSGGLDA